MIKLIHCHIPKTGGVSFLKVIEEIYGENAIAFPWTWLGMAPEEGKGFKMMWYKWPELRRVWAINVPRIARERPELRVLQGHHPVGLFNGLFPHAKRIAWVRHPVQRVLSNYKHDMYKRHQRQMQLEEYIELPHNRNVMSFYVGHDIDNMDWIGALERIDHDMIELAELLRWRNVPKVQHLNKSNAIYKHVDGKGLFKQIADLNMQDMEIYASVIARKPEVRLDF